MSAAAQPAGELQDQGALAPAQYEKAAAEIAARLEAFDAAQAAREAAPASPEPEARPATRGDARRVLELPAALDELSERAAAELRARNDPPRLFDRMGVLVRIDRPGAPVEVLNEHRLRFELAEACTFACKGARGEARPASPPKELAQNLLAAPPGAWRLPKLRAVKGGPVFNRSGELLTAQGFHEAEGIFIADSVAVETFEGSGAEAAQWLADEVYGDFPLEDRASLANTLAFGLTVLARDVFGGLAPLFLASAPTPGSGKDLLLKATAAGTVGMSRAAFIAWSDDHEEGRKRLFSALERGLEITILDNLKTGLDDPSLAAALTAQIYSDRPLGKSEIREVPVETAFAATANNPSLSTEMVRRIFEARLSPATETPWTRQGFRHADLIAWAESNRGRILGAFAAMVNEWTRQGRPAWSGGALGSFETWSRTIGGILEACEVRGFLENRTKLLELADLEGAAWRAFVEAWAERFGERETLSGELFELARTVDGLSFRGASDRAQSMAFGRKLAKLRDRFFGPYQILKIPSAKSGARYRLARAGEFGELGDNRTRVPCARARASETRGETIPQIPQYPETDFFDEVGEAYRDDTF